MGWCPIGRSLRFVTPFVFGLTAAEIWAEERSCPDPILRIETRASPDPDTLCDLAMAARDSVSVCGLSQTAPVTIRLTDDIVHATGACLATYDCTTNRVEILRPDAIPGRITAEDPYGAIPPGAVFRSLLTHELAHALLDQTVGGRQMPVVDHEYVANALELSALPTDHRAAMLATVPVSPPVSDAEINAFLYSIAPRRFAAAAWYHFADNGCDRITRILDGGFSFRRER